MNLKFRVAGMVKQGGFGSGCPTPRRHCFRGVVEVAYVAGGPFYRSPIPKQVGLRYLAAVIWPETRDRTICPRWSPEGPPLEKPQLLRLRPD
jgi:hypothetical protein